MVESGIYQYHFWFALRTFLHFGPILVIFYMHTISWYLAVDLTWGFYLWFYLINPNFLSNASWPFSFLVISSVTLHSFDSKDFHILSKDFPAVTNFDSLGLFRFFNVTNIFSQVEPSKVHSQETIYITSLEDSSESYYIYVRKPLKGYFLKWFLSSSVRVTDRQSAFWWLLQHSMKGQRIHWQRLAFITDIPWRTILKVVFDRIQGGERKIWSKRNVALVEKDLWDWD